MLSYAVVKYFDIVEDARTHLIAGSKVLELDMLSFDGVDEAFRDSIVVTTESEALFQAVSLDYRLKLITRVLTSAVRVQNQSSSKASGI